MIDAGNFITVEAANVWGLFDPQREYGCNFDGLLNKWCL
jgi:hypothetical protein